MKASSRPFFKILGPGILFASTAIGVSHLVQSTRAGADFGFGLVIFIVLANLFKYPFFEFGSRYANATGKSILSGYKNLGQWVLPMYLAVSLLTMFTVTGAVTLVTAGLIVNVAQLPYSPLHMAAGIWGLSILLLYWGKFGVLDGLLKVVGLILLITTLSATVIILANGPEFNWSHTTSPSLSDKGSLLFIIALMGWMPTAMDISSWNSLWTVERIKQTGFRPSIKQTFWEFTSGYLISALLALCFVVLGAYLLFGSGEKLSNNAVAFSGQFIKLYTDSIGEWCYPIIALAAISTMLSTSITVLDGYSRSTGETLQLLGVSRSKTMDLVVMLSLSIVGYMIISVFAGNMAKLIDLATTLSFLVAPIIALINYKVIHSADVEEGLRPQPWLRYLSILGIVFLTLFSVVYLVILFV